MSTKPPTRDIGSPAPSIVSGSGLPGWNAFIDDVEYVPELRWPNSVYVYDQMRNDSQIAGIWSGLTLPIRRYHWMIDPLDAEGRVVQQLAQDLGLPIKGTDKPANRRSHRTFSFDRHLAHALLAPVYGHMFFSQVGEYRDADSYWHLTQISPRMPKTIGEINVDETSGRLISIKQNIGWNPPVIKVPQLVAYVWEQEGANFVGRSMLRPLYRDWLIKDRLLRVDAIKHERNGVGIPIIEAPPGATPAQMDAMDAMAQEYKVGERAGGVLPNGSRLSLVGTSGSLPDTIGSIRYLDEAMARSLLMMFLQLGQTETGSRALGEEFVDYTALAQEALALWFVEDFNLQIIENWVDWNFGEDANVPALTFERNEDPSLSVADLSTMVDKGLITVDGDLESSLRKRYRLPEKPVDDDEAPSGKAFQYDLELGVITIDERRAQLGLPPLPNGEGNRLLVTAPDPDEDEAPSTPEPGVEPPVGGEAPPAPAQPQTGPITTAAVRASMNPAYLPPRDLRRQPYDHEVAAQTDFAAIDFKIDDGVNRLTTLWADIRAAQIDELGKLIIAADGDVKVLAGLQATPIGSDTLRPVLIEVMEDGAILAQEEAMRQGVRIPKPALDDAAAHIAARAEALDELLTRDLSEAAARSALARTGSDLSADQVAAEVKAHLNSLSDAYLKDQFNGAITQAMNTGRRETMRTSDEDPRIYASELLDSNTCSNCTAVDGREYGPNLSAAERDYPTGGYKECKGGPRCRGTLVAVYAEGEIE